MLHSAESITDERQLKRSVTEALHGSGRPELRSLSVQIEADCAIISGCVPTYYARQLAQSIARRVEGVQGIRDEMNVQDARRPILSR